MIAVLRVTGGNFRRNGSLHEGVGACGWTLAARARKRRSEFSGVDYPEIYLVAFVFASKPVAESPWKSAEVVPLSVGQIELPKWSLPFRFPVTVGRPNF